MKIAVIGGSGFLGKEIVNLLESQENEVACLHRNEHPDCNQDVLRLIPSAINHFKENSPFLLKNPNSISDWITSRDVAGAVKYCISESTPQIVDVGTGVPTSNKDIINLLRLKMGAPEDLLILPTNSRASSLYLDVKNSFLHTAGCIPKDNVSHGLDWILESCQ